MGNSDGGCCKVTVDESGDSIAIQVDNTKTRPDSFINLNDIQLQSKLDERQKIQQKTQDKQETVIFPQVSENVNSVLQTNQYFTMKLDNTLPIKKLRGHYYQGGQDEDKRPHGYGKLIYSSGAVFIGNFTEGIANGEGLYIWPNGSYYYGQLQKNKACDKNGYYKCQNFVYRGGVRDNRIQGEGVEEGVDYKFQGEYLDYKRVRGKLHWTQRQIQNNVNISNQSNEQQEGQYTYEGAFDENNEFTGIGVLKGPKGTYEGNFKNGLKDGEGKFMFKNGSRYQGTYQEGVKEGNGTIYLKNDEIAYCGNMHNGLPEGDGWIPGSKGERTYMKFEQGISTVFLENVVQPEDAVS